MNVFFNNNKFKLLNKLQCFKGQSHQNYLSVVSKQFSSNNGKVT